MSTRKRYTEEQIITVVKQFDAEARIAPVGSAHGVTGLSISRWGEKYSGIIRTELSLQKSLQDEEAREKRFCQRRFGNFRENWVSVF